MKQPRELPTNQPTDQSTITDIPSLILLPAALLSLSQNGNINYVFEVANDPLTAHPKVGVNHDSGLDTSEP